MPRFYFGDHVWGRNTFREDLWWPGVVVNPEKDAPKHVRNLAIQGRVCVMFCGPSYISARPRDYYYFTESELLPWDERNEKYKKQDARSEELQGVFQIAVEEAIEMELGVVDAFAAAHEAVVEDQDQQDHHLEPPNRMESLTISEKLKCTDCGKGYIKVEASYDRCKACRKQYLKEHSCGVCLKLWNQNEKNMACCDNCNLWIHAACDPKAQEILEAGDDERYYCPNCRPSPSTGENPLAEYEARLREMKPAPPRSTYLLFSTEMIRCYRNEGIEFNYRDLIPIIAEAYRNMQDEERQQYEAAVEDDTQVYEILSQMYDAIFEEYEVLAGSLEHAIPRDLIPDSRAHSMPTRALPAPRPAPSMSASHKRQRASSTDDHEAPAPKVARKVVPGPDLKDLPVELSVACNGVRGAFILATQRVVCRCKDCAKLPMEEREYTPTQFEQHAGAGSAKKWKASLRIEPGTVPEVGMDGPGMQIGKWLEMKGIDAKGSRPTGEGAGHRRH